jgi:hypothetical protein
MRSHAVRAAVLPVIVGLLVVGCALSGSSRHQATVGAVTLYESLAAIQDGADTLHTAAVLTDAQHRAVARELVPVLQAGKAATTALRTWPSGQPAPGELRDLVAALGTFAERLGDFLPDSPGKATILGLLVAAQQVALTVLMLTT